MGARLGDPSEVVLLGTAAGRTWSGGSRRQGIASALTVGDSVYLVDCGAGWGRRYLQAGLGEQRPFRGLERLRAVFLTHLHADHIVDLPQLLTFGLSDGLAAVHRPVRIFGPGPRGELPSVRNVGQNAGGVPVVAPDNPMPGTEDTIAALFRAFAADLNDNMRDSLKPDPRRLLSVRDIPLPPWLQVQPNVCTAPPVDPFAVYEDELVRVSATLVDHAPVFPAFAFHFETPHGAVVFSGDTNACPNLVRLAEGAQVLVHEVIDPTWVAGLFPAPATPAQAAKAEHLIHAHTPIEQVGSVAEAAGVRTLVLTHLAPPEPRPSRWHEAQAGFSGRLVVGDDLVRVSLAD